MLARKFEPVSEHFGPQHWFSAKSGGSPRWWGWELIAHSIRLLCLGWYPMAGRKLPGSWVWNNGLRDDK